MVLSGSMGTGEFMSFIAYVHQILFSLMMVSMVFIDCHFKGVDSRAIEVLSTEPLSKTTTLANLSVQTAALCLQCLSILKERKKNVLDNINLSIKSGEVIGALSAALF